MIKGGLLIDVYEGSEVADEPKEPNEPEEPKKPKVPKGASAEIFPPGKREKVSAKDAYVITVMGDKVSHFQVNSPADGGIPAMLAQLGVKMPAM